MFKQRLISGIILVLIAAFGLYMGGIVTFAMTLIVALIDASCMPEMSYIQREEKVDRCIDRIQRDFKDLSY